MDVVSEINEKRYLEKQTSVTSEENYLEFSKRI